LLSPHSLNVRHTPGRRFASPVGKLGFCISLRCLYHAVVTWVSWRPHGGCGRWSARIRQDRQPALFGAGCACRCARHLRVAGTRNVGTLLAHSAGSAPTCADVDCSNKQTCAAACSLLWFPLVRLLRYRAAGLDITFAFMPCLLARVSRHRVSFACLYAPCARSRVAARQQRLRVPRVAAAQTHTVSAALRCPAGARRARWRRAALASALTLRLCTPATPRCMPLYTRTALLFAVH